MRPQISQVIFPVGRSSLGRTCWYVLSIRFCFMSFDERSGFIDLLEVFWGFSLGPLDDLVEFWDFVGFLEESSVIRSSLSSCRSMSDWLCSCFTEDSLFSLPSSDLPKLLKSGFRSGSSGLHEAPVSSSKSSANTSQSSRSFSSQSFVFVSHLEQSDSCFVNEYHSSAINIICLPHGTHRSQWKCAKTCSFRWGFDEKVAGHKLQLNGSWLPK